LKSPAAVVSIEIAADDILSIRAGRGEWVECDVCGDTYVLWFLTVLNLRRAVDGRRLSVAILPDAVDPEEFRQLRVWLRWKEKGETPAT
jgi:toxin CptA